MTKHRYKILEGDVGQRCRELLREIAKADDMQIHAGAINRDHVNMCLSIPPNLSLSRDMQDLKSYSTNLRVSASGAGANIL